MNKVNGAKIMVYDRENDYSVDIDLEIAHYIPAHPNFSTHREKIIVFVFNFKWWETDDGSTILNWLMASDSDITVQSYDVQ